MTAGFWNGKRVLVTGHTGFKGAWLSLWLRELQAEACGFSLDPPSVPSLFGLAGLDRSMRSVHGDIRDGEALDRAFAGFRPEIVFHLAAQALVRPSFTDPAETYSTNVMGTVNVLEAARRTESVRTVVVVTSDKCYENREWVWGYRENDPMGGYDPYSASKGCAELVVSSYRRSFFDPAAGGRPVALSSVRAGNVIGGGDWGADRLLPDCMRALTRGQTLVIRNPNAVRPWQHVLDPLNGYLMLAARTWDAPELAGGWNFGPALGEVQPVRWVADQIIERWGGGAKWELDRNHNPHEAGTLRLDSTKASVELGWKPRLQIRESLNWVVDWFRLQAGGEPAERATVAQIQRFMAL